MLFTQAPASQPDSPTDSPPAAREVVVVGSRRTSAPGRASSRVERQDIEERLPRSAPDALRYEPGVYVQQSAHGQGSPYIRGRTGQQTVVLFDGIRLNTSTWRQGPNQYFFTVDSAAVRSIEVTRGGASTLFGSDAIAGVIEARPLEPTARSRTPRAWLPAGARICGWPRPTASAAVGRRLDAAGSVRGWPCWQGWAHRRVGALRGGGAVRSPATGEIPMVPALEADGATQLGTGWDELTADARLSYQLAAGIAAAGGRLPVPAVRFPPHRPVPGPVRSTGRVPAVRRAVPIARLPGARGPPGTGRAAASAGPCPTSGSTSGAACGGRHPS